MGPPYDTMAMAIVIPFCWLKQKPDLYAAIIPQLFPPRYSHFWAPKVFIFLSKMRTERGGVLNFF